MVNVYPKGINAYINQTREREREREIQLPFLQKLLDTEMEMIQLEFQLLP